jgi:hypothetical protein
MLMVAVCGVMAQTLSRRISAQSQQQPRERCIWRANPAGRRPSAECGENMATWNTDARPSSRRLPEIETDLPASRAHSLQQLCTLFTFIDPVNTALQTSPATWFADENEKIQVRSL